jgi:hypothetical protein
MSALLVAVQVNKKRQESCEDLNRGAPPRFFYSSQGTVMSTKSAVLQNIIHYCTCKLSYVMHTVHWWKLSMHGTLKGTVSKFNNFFSNSCRWVTFGKYGLLIQNRARHLKQYFFVSLRKTFLHFCQ